MEEVRVLAANGQLGYGFPISSFKEGMSRNPDIVGVDAGSTDGGPAFLGNGTALTSKNAVKRDLEIIIAATLERKIPFIIGSAATAGGEPHIASQLEIIKKIASENNYSLKIAVIHNDIPKKFVRQKLKEDKITPLGSNVPMLTIENIESSIRIVGQMGVTPFIKALSYKPDIILAGRACDTAIFAALPIKKGFDPALAFHAAKVIECGAYCAVPGEAADCMLAIIRKNDFILEPVNKIRKCTPVSVAAHTMYEQSHPSVFYEPDGMIDSSEAEFEQYSKTAVRVWGTKFVPVKDIWKIKLEGSAIEGYRTICIAGARDPYLIKHIEILLETVKQEVASIVGEKDYTLKYRVYGRDAVLGELESKQCKSHELGIIIEAIGKNQEIADSVCALARSTLLHQRYPERRTTGGNISFPFSPSDISIGPVYYFSLYHLLEVEDPDKLFPIEIVEV